MMLTTRLAPLAALLLVFAPPLLAQDEELPDLALEASVLKWNYDLGGTVIDEDGDVIPLDEGRGTGDRSQTIIRAALLSNLWWLPDVELRFNELEGGTQTTIEGASFGGVQLAADEQVTAVSALDETSLALRYPLQRDGIRLSVGVLLKKLDGMITVSNEDGSEQQTEEYDEVVPLASVQATLAPFGPFRLRLEGAYIEADGDRATEFAARMLWPIIDPFGIELGFLSKDFEFKTDDFAVDADFRGGYFGFLGVF